MSHFKLTRPGKRFPLPSTGRPGGLRDPEGQQAFASSPPTSATPPPAAPPPPPNRRDAEGQAATPANCLPENKSEVRSASNNASLCPEPSVCRAGGAAQAARQGGEGRIRRSADALRCSALRPPPAPRQRLRAVGCVRNGHGHGSHRYKTQSPSLPELRRG